MVLNFQFFVLILLLAFWMALTLVNLCFRLIWILWKKAHGWLHACNRWLALNPYNMFSIIRTGYFMLLSKYLFLELYLIVESTHDSADFSGTGKGNSRCYQNDFRRKRFPLLTTLVTPLVPSGKPIPIFRQGNMMWKILYTPWLDMVCSWIFNSLSLFPLGLLNGSCSSKIMP